MPTQTKHQHSPPPQKPLSLCIKSGEACAFLCRYINSQIQAEITNLHDETSQSIPPLSQPCWHQPSCFAATGLTSSLLAACAVPSFSDAAVIHEWFSLNVTGVQLLHKDYLLNKVVLYIHITNEED